MLGSSVGGGIVFIEPAQVVSQNNELAAARAEAMAAEENVLWELSGRVMGVQDDVEMVRLSIHMLLFIVTNSKYC